MFVKYHEKTGFEVIPETDDVCFSCLNCRDCPLISALKQEITVLRYEGITIHNCALFMLDEVSATI
ncbi:MAG: hypothetical protein WCK67_12405 [bacterium]